MKILKLIFTLAMAVVLTTALILSTMDEQKHEVVLAGANEDSKEKKDPSFQDEQTTPPKKVSRFLAAVKNPRAADHCHKDNEVCLLEGSQGSTCCNNKCVDLQTDSKNCGACKRKCKYTDTCCRGECVNLSFDKRHCGKCNNKCMPGGYCIYGMCDYA